MTPITGKRLDKIIAAIKESRRQRDLCNGSVWTNLVRILGEREAEVAMANLMWADPGFCGGSSKPQINGDVTEEVSKLYR